MYYLRGLSSDGVIEVPFGVRSNSGSVVLPTVGVILATGKLGRLGKVQIYPPQISFSREFPNKLN